MYTFLLTLLLLVNSTLIYLTIKKDSSKELYKLNSPIVISLYGVFLFYIFPIFYWLFFRWPYEQPSYYEGYLEVQFALFLFLLPVFFFPNNIHVNLKLENSKKFSSQITLHVILAVLVLLNTIYETFILGNQGRLEFSSYEETSSAYFLTNILKDYGLFFILALFLNKNSKVKTIATIILILYTIATILSFHRFAILITLFEAFIFFTLLGFIKIKPRKLILYSIILIFLIVGVIGKFGLEAISYVYLNGVSNGKSFGLQDIINIGLQTYNNFTFSRPNVFDDIFLRLNQARSASAVIHLYTDTNDFYYGETFISIIFFFIPRFIFPGKPNMAEVHGLTVKFMGNDFGGVNPLGSLAESFINFNFIGIFFCSFLFYFFILILVKIINQLKSKYLIAIYPYLAFMFFAFDLNLSQRIVQISKALIFFILLRFLFQLFSRKKKILNE
jgi:hypothetical protein